MAEKEAERERKGIRERGTHLALTQRLTKAKAHARAPRIEGELTAFERRLRDAREYGWVGMDAAALGAEMAELEDKLARAEAEEEALAALASVDLRRKPLDTRIRKAIMERTAIAKPGMALYAPEDLEDLGTIGEELTEVQKALTENTIAVVTSRQTLGALSAVTTEFARTAAANLADGVEKSAAKLTEIELKLKEITERHARANVEDRDKLTQLMDGLEPRLRREPRLAMAGGSSTKEIDYLIKKAWLEQHDQTQRLAKDELWQLVAGFSPDEGRVAYFELEERMGEWRIHLSLDYGVDAGRRRHVLGVRHPRRDLRRERRRRAALARHRRGARPQRRPQPPLLLRHRQGHAQAGLLEHPRGQGGQAQLERPRRAS